MVDALFAEMRRIAASVGGRSCGGRPPTTTTAPAAPTTRSRPARPGSPTTWPRNERVLTLSQVIVGVQDLDAASRTVPRAGFRRARRRRAPRASARPIVSSRSASSTWSCWASSRSQRRRAPTTAVRCCGRSPAATGWCAGRCAPTPSTPSPRAWASPPSTANAAGPTASCSRGAPAGLDEALADATLPFFMQWDRPDLYPGLMPAAHANGATRVCCTGDHAPRRGRARAPDRGRRRPDPGRARKRARPVERDGRDRPRRDRGDRLSEPGSAQLFRSSRLRRTLSM